MNSSFITRFISILVLAIVSYFVVNAFGSSLTSAVSISIGVLLGGLLSLVMTMQFSFTSSDSSGTDGTALSTLYVGNLPYRANEQAVQEHFEQFGVVSSVRLMKDRRTGKRKGYGFVEMESKGANKSIKNLNDSIFQERTLKVRLAKDKVEEEEQ